MSRLYIRFFVAFVVITAAIGYSYYSIQETVSYYKEETDVFVYKVNQKVDDFEKGDSDMTEEQLLMLVKLSADRGSEYYLISHLMKYLSAYFFFTLVMSLILTAIYISRANKKVVEPGGEGRRE